MLSAESFMVFFTDEFPSIFGISACLGASALFSCSETAITALGTMKAKHFLDQQEVKQRSLNWWIHHPGQVLTTILLFNTVVNILASALTTELTTRHLTSGVVGISTFSATFFILIFGEVIPKSFAKRHEWIALPSLKLIYFIYRLAFPLVSALSALAEFCIRFLSRGSPRAPGSSITEAEIEFLVNEGEKAGVIKDIKKNIIEGAFDLDETLVREIMTPRTDMVSVRSDDTISHLVDLFKMTGHSRIPVYEESLDHITGVVLAKDVLHQSFSDQIKPFTIRGIMRAPVFAPESNSILDLFKELKRTRSHMAIIIDEYGGTAGLVTMEDILEKIVGDIQDEHDREQSHMVEIQPGVFEVLGSLSIEDFFEAFPVPEKEGENFDEQAEDVDTLAGWINLQSKQVPRAGLKVVWGPWLLEVVEARRKRVNLVRVSKQSLETVTPNSAQPQASQATVSKQKSHSSMI